MISRTCMHMQLYATRNSVTSTKNYSKKKIIVHQVCDKYTNCSGQRVAWGHTGGWSDIRHPGAEVGFNRIQSDAKSWLSFQGSHLESVHGVLRLAVLGSLTLGANLVCSSTIIEHGKEVKVRMCVRSLIRDIAPTAYHVPHTHYLVVEEMCPRMLLHYKTKQMGMHGLHTLLHTRMTNFAYSTANGWMVRSWLAGCHHMVNL